MTTDHYSEETEKAVAGALIGLDAAEAVDICTEVLTPGMFFHGGYAKIAETAYEIRNQNKPVSILTVGDQLKLSGAFDNIGGTLALNSMLDIAPPLAHVRHHAEKVRDMYGRRLLAKTFRDMAAELETAQSAEEVRSKAEFKLAQMARKDTHRESAKQAGARVKENWTKAREMGQNRAGISTGFPRIDRCFTLRRQGFYLISGEQKQGKTTLLRNILEYVAEKGIPVALKTLEQSIEMILSASAARHAEQSMYSLDCGSKRADLERAKSSVDHILSLPFHIDDTPTNNTQLWSWARRMVSKENCRILAVDYAQLIAGDQSRMTTEQVASQAAQTLMQIPKELDCVMIAVSSLSYGGRVRGSSQFGYNVWAHLKLSWEDEDQSIVRVDITDNRFGPRSHCEMRLVGNRQEIVEHGGVEEWK